MQIKFIRGDSQAITAFCYFKNLRNKHFVHDENSYRQSKPGAVLNRRDEPYKIEKIVCLDVTGETLTRGNYTNLSLLIEAAQVWVAGEFDHLCQVLTKELEAQSYDDLFNRHGIIYEPPQVDEVGKNRNEQY